METYSEDNLADNPENYKGDSGMCRLYRACTIESAKVLGSFDKEAHILWMLGNETMTSVFRVNGGHMVESDVVVAVERLIRKFCDVQLIVNVLCRAWPV